MTTNSIILFLLWVGLILSDTAAQLSLKVGSMEVSGGGHFSRYLLFGYALIFCSFLTWMQILRRMRLVIALSISSVLYVTVVLASHFVLGEVVRPSLLAGTILIAIGVCLQSFNQRNLDSV